MGRKNEDKKTRDSKITKSTIPFTIRQFNNTERLGDKLKALRKELNFTLLDMERKTKINRSYLAHLETGKIDKLPDPIYTRNFIKIYLRVLGADETYYLDLYEQERGTCDFVDQARMPRQKTRALRFLVASRFVKFASFILIAGSVVFYLGLQVRAIVTPPVLYVLEPTDGMTTQSATIAVTGSVELGATVYVNGEKILLTSNGSFDKEVALERGTNLIKIESVKRYSRPSVEYRRIVLEQRASITMSDSSRLSRVDN